MSSHKEIKKLWGDRLKEPEIFYCFCHVYRCPHRDYSLCPKNCEKPTTREFCPLGNCQMALQHPEECDKQMRELQEKGREKVKHIHKIGDPENRDYRTGKQ